MASEIAESIARVREEADRRVAAERARMEMLFEKAPALIAHLSGPQHVFRFANALYRGIVTPRQLVGLPFREAMPELGAPVYEVLDRVYRTGETDVVREMPVRIRRAETGQLEDIWVHFVNQAVRDEHGNIEGILCHGFEVTEQVRARLEAEQLAQARQETVTVLEERAAFEQQLIGIVSHDLRNPLQASLIGAQALLRSPDTDATQRAISTRIESSVSRALRMISDLLDFTQARIGGGIPVRPSDIDLRQVAEQVLQELRINYPDRQLDLSEEGDTRGRWDWDRLAQVMANLVTNAIRHGADGGRVQVKLAGAPDGFVAFEVRNEGSPIPPAALERLFEPMVRGRERTATGRGGLGLGLFISRHLVEAHGGSIDVSSTEQDGTRFTVRLPRAPRSGPSSRGAERSV